MTATALVYAAIFFLPVAALSVVIFGTASGLPQLVLSSQPSLRLLSSGVGVRTRFQLPQGNRSRSCADVCVSGPRETEGEAG